MSGSEWRKVREQDGQTEAGGVIAFIRILEVPRPLHGLCGKQPANLPLGLKGPLKKEIVLLYEKYRKIGTRFFVCRFSQPR